jgi:hypothetical protein
MSILQVILRVCHILDYSASSGTTQRNDDRNYFLGNGLKLIEASSRHSCLEGLGKVTKILILIARVPTEIPKDYLCNMDVGR